MMFLTPHISAISPRSWTSSLIPMWGRHPARNTGPRFISRSRVMEFQPGPHDCDQSVFLVSFQMGAEVVVDEQPVGGRPGRR